MKEENNFFNKENINLNNNNKNLKRYFGRDITNIVINKDFNIKEYYQSKQITKIKSCNPQLVEEFQGDIIENWKKEINSFDLINNYWDNQFDLTSLMREILIDWMIDVHEEYDLSQNCLFKAITILDIVLSHKEIKRNKLQLIGLTSIFISSKYEEIYPLRIKKLFKVCDNAFNYNEIVMMEKEILNILNYKLITPDYMNFINIMKNILNLNEKAVVYSMYLIETSLLSYDILKYTFYEFLAGIYFLINKIFNKIGWNEDLKNLLNVDERLAKSCAKKILMIEKNHENSKFTAIKRKYSTDKNYQISKYKIEKT